MKFLTSDLSDCNNEQKMWKHLGTVNYIIMDFKFMVVEDDDVSCVYYYLFFCFFVIKL